jgi:ankyrin repeat protein
MTISRSKQQVIFSAWKRGDKPESESLDRRIRHFGDLLLREYIAFIKEPAVDRFDRSQTIPMLLEVFLAPRLIEVLRSWMQDGLGIAVGQLLSHGHPVGFAFEWLEHKYPQAWNAYEGTRYKAYAGRDDRLAGWRTGDHVPCFGNLLGLLDDFIKKAGINASEALNIRELFFVARTLAAFFKATESYGFLGMVRERLFNSERVVDPIERLQAHYSGNLHSVMKQVEPLNRLNDDISNRLFSNPNRSENEAESIDEQLVRAETLCDQLKGVNAMWWRTVRLRAVWFICYGRVEEARKEYRRLFDFIFYVGMEDLDRIYHEALVFAAVCGDRVFLRELKNLGMLFGRYSAPIEAQNSKASKKHKTAEIEDWEVVSWANTFQEYFPKTLFFDGVKPIASGTSLKSNPLSWYPAEQLLQIKDWRDPLKQLKNVGGKRLTALMYFTRFGKIEEVRELMAMGADVNILSSSNDSALLMAIQRATPTELRPTDFSFFEAISTIDHDVDVLNTPTDEVKLTVLGCAVESGNPAIVKRVLEMGADPNQPCDVDQVSPLYKAVHAFSRLPGFDDFIKQFSAGSPKLMESIRRHAPSMGMDFVSLRRAVEQMTSGPRHHEIGMELFECLRKKQGSSVREEQLREIIELLLVNGADPNQGHSVNGWKGYTPLMLAIELRQPELVEAMLNKENPVQVNLNQKASLPDGRQFDVKGLACQYQFPAVLGMLAKEEG